MKTAVVYASYHHGNTKKVLDAIAEKYEIELIDALRVTASDLNDYELIGFASGIYFSKFHKAVLNFADKCLPEGKKVFLLCTYGNGGSYKAIEDIVTKKKGEIVGRYGCKGFDSYGPFKLVGGIAKGHPDEQELADAQAFFGGLTETDDEGK